MMGNKMSGIRWNTVSEHCNILELNLGLELMIPLCPLKSTCRPSNSSHTKPLSDRVHLPAPPFLSAKEDLEFSLLSSLAQLLSSP